MRDAYFGIDECTEEELYQLRENLFWCEDLDDEMYEEVFDEEDRKVLENCEDPEDIPFEMLKKFYGEVSFVDEDFWCNC